MVHLVGEYTSRMDALNKKNDLMTIYVFFALPASLAVASDGWNLI